MIYHRGWKKADRLRKKKRLWFIAYEIEVAALEVKAQDMARAEAHMEALRLELMEAKGLESPSIHPYPPQP